MKAFLGGLAAMIIISVVAAFALQGLDDWGGDRGVSERGSVRLDEER